MNATSLENKTIRPGSLIGYSYYHSDRRPLGAAKAKATQSKARTKAPRRHFGAVTVLVLLALVGVAFYKGYTANSAKQPAARSTPPAVPAAAAVPAVTNHCAGNKLKQTVIVSISQRHLWACEGATTAYDSPVVTGIDYLAADKTPTGSYRIYAKDTNVTLTGSDTTGSWSDPVSYWMPFLHNQYGSYGFHDATWRSDSDFGNISPNSPNASHGCVELPLATAAWLYNWTSVGTTVRIET